MNTIIIENLRKCFGDFEAVAGISLEVPAGSVFGLLGANGSGKSTTVKMLAGQLAPTSGDALLAGASITAEPLKVKAGLGVLPEGDTLFGHLTLMEHLRFEGRARGLEPAEIDRRAESLLRFFDLWDKRHTFAGNGSTGMKKKLGISLALIHRPAILILDEPFEGLDPIAADALQKLIQSLARGGVTILITSHLLTLLERLLDHLALIKAGQILSVTPMDRLKARGEDLNSVYQTAFGSGPNHMEDLAWLL